MFPNLSLGCHFPVALWFGIPDGATQSDATQPPLKSQTYGEGKKAPASLSFWLFPVKSCRLWIVFCVPHNSHPLLKHPLKNVHSQEIPTFLCCLFSFCSHTISVVLAASIFLWRVWLGLSEEIAHPTHGALLVCSDRGKNTLSTPSEIEFESKAVGFTHKQTSHTPKEMAAFLLWMKWADQINNISI